MKRNIKFYRSFYIFWNCRTMKCFYLVLCWMSLNEMPCNALNGRLSLVANTYSVQSGETKTLTINCTWEGQSGESSELAKFSLIQKPTGKENTEIILASIDNSKNKLSMHTNKAVGQGYLNTGLKSFLSLKWYYPLSDVAGEYTCAAIGVDDYSVTENKTIDATSVSETLLRNILLSVDKLETTKQEYVSMQSEVDTLRNTLLNTNTLLNRTIQEFETLKSRIHESKLSYFKISDVYEGRRYYLSQYERIANKAASMATCILYGGYLAEIDDEKEFKFIQSFVKKFSGISLILVGGNDEELEGIWVFEHSKKRVDTFFVKDDRKIRKFNCLYLYDSLNWYATDSACYLNSGDWITRFLCEIPESK